MVKFYIRHFLALQIFDKRCHAAVAPLSGACIKTFRAFGSFREKFFVFGAGKGGFCGMPGGFRGVSKHEKTTYINLNKIYEDRFSPEEGRER